jgi:transcription elongation factor Elf1
VYVSNHNIYKETAIIMQERIKCPYCGYNQSVSKTDKEGKPSYCSSCSQQFVVKVNS